MDVAGFVDGKNKSERVRLLNGAGHTPLACRVGQPLFTCGEVRATQVYKSILFPPPPPSFLLGKKVFSAI